MHVSYYTPLYSHVLSTVLRKSTYIYIYSVFVPVVNTGLIVYKIDIIGYNQI